VVYRMLGVVVEFWDLLWQAKLSPGE